MKALVTGGAGFIGSHLVDRLLAEGHSVKVLDNFATGRPENLASVESSTGLSLHQVDITNPADVYHRANVEGTLTVLEAARKAGIKRFVYAASAACYGLPDQFPTPESAPMRPMYPYAFTKYVGEQSVMHWCQVYQMPCVSLRLFNVYGPRARASGTYGAVFGVFMAQKLAGKPFTVGGDGNQTRDFTFVTDVADAFLRAAQWDQSGEIMNVGSGSTYSVNHLVELLGGEVTYVPKRPGEPDCTFADTQSIRRNLGWEAKVSFEEGVGIMLDNIHMWDGAPVWDAESITGATKDWFKYLGNETNDGVGKSVGSKPGI